MNYFTISLFICCTFAFWSSNGQQHNLFYGRCTPNNADSEAVFSQIISIRNRNRNFSAARPIRRWMNSVRNVFRQTTTALPFLNGQSTNTTFNFPPYVSFI